MKRIVPLAALLLALAMFGTARAAEPCPAGRSPLMILGVFHMESSEDAVKSNPGDMSSARRQAEIADLVEHLARFKPTLVCVESPRTSTYWNDRYAKWLKGEYTLGGNEIEQVGFRLAKRAGLERLTPVDYPMWMNGLTPAERHTPRARPAASEPAAAPAAPESPLVADIHREVAKGDSILARSTVRAYLAYLNTPEQAAMHHRWDVLSNLEPGDGESLYENTDLAANWYKRNLRIFTNLLEVSKPGDRLVLIIGAGHLQILGDLAEAHPSFCRVDPREFLK